MKEKVIRKINNVGRISYVIVWGIGILLTIGMIISLILTVVCFKLPEDTLRTVLNGELNLSVNYENLGFEDEQLKVGESEQVSSPIEEFGDFSIVMGEKKYHLNELEYGEGNLLMRAKIENMELNMRDIAILCLGVFLEIGMTLITLCFVGSLCRAIRKCESPFEKNVVRKIKNLAIVLLPWSILSSVITTAMENWTKGIIYVGISIDLGLILLLVVLIYIFKYGAVLQQESDETL